MVPHDQAQIDLWIVDCRLVDKESIAIIEPTELNEVVETCHCSSGTPTWAHRIDGHPMSDALLVYAGPYLDIARIGGQHLPQVEPDSCTAGPYPDHGAGALAEGTAE
jgi:hypothetical protein